MTNPPRPPFGPVEDFGDMDRDQRFMMPVGSPGPGIIDLLEQATFEVSHASTWGFRPYRSEIRFRGAGLRRSIREDAVGQIATAVGGYGQKLDKIGQALDSVTRRLRPPAEGGDDLDLKVCAACGWERFTYYGSGQYAEFWCANCGTKHENRDCECAVTWCEHRAAPRQCVRK